MDDCNSAARMSLESTTQSVDTSQSGTLKRQTKPRTQSVNGLPQRTVKRHDCIGATRSLQQGGVDRRDSTRLTSLNNSKQKSSSESNLRAQRSRMELTDVYDDTHSSKSHDRSVTRTVELRRVANLAKAKKLDDHPKKPLVQAASGLQASRSRSPLPSTLVQPSKGNRPAAMQTSQRPNTLLLSPNKVRPPKTSSQVRKSTSSAKSQVRTPASRTPFRLFEPIADESLKGRNLMGAEYNQSMPNLLRQNRRSSYSDDSIDGSYADIPDEDHTAFFNDSASEFDENQQVPKLRASKLAESLESAVSMPQLTMNVLGDNYANSMKNTRYPLTPPDSGRQRFDNRLANKTSKLSYATQTEATTTVHCDTQTEPSAATYAFVQTDPTRTDCIGTNSNFRSSTNAHVQTEVSPLAKGTVSCATQTEPTESEEAANTAEKSLGVRSVECETQTDVSCLYKISSKHAVVLKSRELPLNELNFDSDSDSSLLKFKHGRREVTESDYFVPRLSGTRSPALSDPGSRHDYIKAHSLPLHFVSTRPNIFPSNLDTELDEDDSDLDGSSDSLSDDTVVDDAPPNRQVTPNGANGKRRLPDRTRVLSRAVPYAPKVSENQAKEVAHDWSQTEADRETNSVTINLMVRKPKPKLTPVKTCANFYFQSAAPGANWYV